MMRRPLILILALACLVASATVGGSLEGLRLEAGLTDFESGIELTPGEFLGQKAAGPIRVVPIVLFVAQFMEAFKNQEWHRALAVSRLLSQLAPRVPAVWMLHGWNMAVNISYDAYESGEPERAYEWLRAGLDHIKTGTERNPRDPEIRFYHALMLWRALDPRAKKPDVLAFYRSRFEEEGRDPRAEALLEADRACELAPGDHRYQGFAFQARQQLADEALAEGNRGLALELLNDAVPHLEAYEQLVEDLTNDPRTAEANRTALRALMKNLDEKKVVMLATIDELRNDERVEPSDPY